MSAEGIGSGGRLDGGGGRSAQSTGARRRDAALAVAAEMASGSSYDAARPAALAAHDRRCSTWTVPPPQRRS